MRWAALVAGLAAVAGTSMRGAPSDAQGLRTLQVDALTMHASRTRVAVGEDFTLTIHAHVRQRIAALDELVIPDVGTMHVLGDERRAAAAAGGTDIDEVLTLEPVEAGTFSLPGASLDAIDARTGKPTRFTANGVRIIVGSNAQPPAVRSAAGIVLGLALAAMAALVAWRAVTVVRRRRATPAVPPPVVQDDAPRAPREDVRRALDDYRANPRAETLAQLRAALFRAAGAAPGATLRDAQDRAADDFLLAALRAADAAAFADSPLRGDPIPVVEAVVAWLR